MKFKFGSTSVENLTDEEFYSTMTFIGASADVGNVEYITGCSDIDFLPVDVTTIEIKAKGENAPFTLVVNRESGKTENDPHVVFFDYGDGHANVFVLDKGVLLAKVVKELVKLGLANKEDEIAEKRKLFGVE